MGYCSVCAMGTVVCVLWGTVVCVLWGIAVYVLGGEAIVWAIKPEFQHNACDYLPQPLMDQHTTMAAMT